MATHPSFYSFVRNLNQIRNEEQAKLYIELGVQAEAEGINALKGQHIWTEAYRVPHLTRSSAATDRYGPGC